MSSGTSELLVEGGATLDAVELGAGDIAARSPLQLFWRRFRTDRVAMASAIFIVLLILLAVFAPLVINILGLQGPNVQNPDALDAFGSPSGPSSAHIFGVDQLGRDVLSRVLYGARVSLIVGIFGTAIAAFIGTIVGLVAGFYRGWADTLLMRVVDV